jgi:hypothetical protein
MGCCETKSKYLPDTSQLSSPPPNETPAIMSLKPPIMSLKPAIMSLKPPIIRLETPQPMRKPVPSTKEVRMEELSTEIKKIGNGIVLDLKVYKNIPDSESIYVNYIKMRKLKEDRKKGKKIELCDDDQEEIIKSEVEMRKTYYTYGVINNNSTHICLTIGKPKEMKIMYVPGKLDRMYDIEIINFTTKEHLLLWLYEGEINQNDIYKLIKKILNPVFSKTTYKLNIVMDGIYVIDIDSTISVSSIWHFYIKLYT